MNQQLAEARESSDVNAWKLEAQALIDLGHLARWVGRHEDAKHFMAESSRVCRYNTLTKVINDEN